MTFVKILLLLCLLQLSARLASSATIRPVTSDTEPSTTSHEKHGRDDDDDKPPKCDDGESTTDETPTDGEADKSKHHAKPPHPSKKPRTRRPCPTKATKSSATEKLGSSDTTTIATHTRPSGKTTGGKTGKNQTEGPILVIQTAAQSAVTQNTDQTTVVSETKLSITEAKVAGTESPTRETKTPGTEETIVVAGTSATPRANQHIGTAETKLSGTETVAPGTESPLGKDKRLGTEEPIIVTGTSATPRGNQHIGTAETKLSGTETIAPGAESPLGKDKSLGTEEPIIVTGTSATPRANQHIGTAETKLTGIETVAPGTKSPSGKDKSLGTEEPIAITETSAAPPANQKMITAEIGTSLTPPALHQTEVSKTESPHTETGAAGSEGSLSGTNMTATPSSPPEDPKTTVSETGTAIELSTTVETTATGTLPPSILLPDGSDVNGTIYNGLELCLWTTYEGCNREYSNSTCINCLVEYNVCANDRCNDACVEKGYTGGICGNTMERRCPCIILGYKPCYCSHRP